MKIRKSTQNYSYLFAAVVIAAGLVGWSLPLPASSAQFSLPQPPLTAPAPTISWPAGGQASLAVKSYGLLESSGVQKPAPTASVAKVFTALAVLKQKPLASGQPGPTITITQADLDSYESYYAAGGSLAPVTLGEQLSERQALEAMLLPSANNMADTLARWAFGSVDNYLAYINQFNSQLGLKQTHITDASGFSSTTVSSAEDLVKIGQLVLAQPVLAQIVNESQATIPVAGLVHNTNWLLGFNGINGIKTGNTDQAGGCYLFSSDQLIGGRQITVIGAVMGAPSLEQALAAGRDLLGSVGSGFISGPALVKGQIVGQYRLPWGKAVPITAANDVPVIYWYKKPYSQNYSAADITSVTKGQSVGNYYLSSGLDGGTTQLVAASDSGHAPWRWRLYQRYL